MLDRSNDSETIVDKTEQPKEASAIGLDEHSNASIEFVERLFACL
jgi:hypothetical protein